MKQRQTIPHHNWQRKLRYLVTIGALPCTVGLYQVQVDHDDWCGIFQRQRCHCTPDIALK